MFHFFGYLNQLKDQFACIGILYLLVTIFYEKNSIHFELSKRIEIVTIFYRYYDDLFFFLFVFNPFFLLANFFFLFYWFNFYPVFILFFWIFCFSFLFYKIINKQKHNRLIPKMYIEIEHWSQISSYIRELSATDCSWCPVINCNISNIVWNTKKKDIKLCLNW